MSSNNENKGVEAATGNHGQIIENQNVSLSSVDLEDRRFQVRAEVDEKTIQQYREVIRQEKAVRLRGFSTRPLLWERPEDHRYVILDGWHRVLAGQREKITEFEADLLDGDPAQALVAAMRANLTHGLPLKAQEREQAILKTIQVLSQEDGTQPSNTDVARRLGISESSVCQYRDKLEMAGKLDVPQKVMGVDGKVQTAKKKCKSGRCGISGHAARNTASTLSGCTLHTSNTGQGKSALPGNIARGDLPTAKKEMQPSGLDGSHSAGVSSGEGHPAAHAEPSAEAQYVQPLEKAVATLQALRRMGWDAIQEAGCDEEVGLNTERLVELGKWLLEDRPVPVEVN